MAEDVVHLCAPGMEEGFVVYAGVRYRPFAHIVDGRTVWLVFGPRGLSSTPVGGSPSGLSVAPAEFQHLRPA
jgi:hypothetical protein